MTDKIIRIIRNATLLCRVFSFISIYTEFEISFNLFNLMDINCICSKRHRQLHEKFSLKMFDSTTNIWIIKTDVREVFPWLMWILTCIKTFIIKWYRVKFIQTDEKFQITQFETLKVTSKKVLFSISSLFRVVNAELSWDIHMILDQHFWWFACILAENVKMCKIS